MTYLRGLKIAFPENKVFQKDVIELSKQIFKSEKSFLKMLKVYQNSGVKTRFIVNEIDWYKKHHNWKTRSLLFKENALDLLKSCISKTLESTKIDVKKLGAVVYINTTGISTPTIDAELINFFCLNSNIIRVPIFGYGCAGGVLGLNRANEIFNYTKKPVLVCNLELCSLTFRPNDFSKANIISTALFGDGASSYLIDKEGDCEILSTFELTWKDTLNLMGWNIENDGLAVVFDKSIPDFIENRFPKIIKKIKPLIDGYILHPGGNKILKAYKKVFNNHDTINISRESLAKFGNVSSVSVLSVLHDILQYKLSGRFLMSAMGPGFTAGVCQLKI